MFDSSSFHKLFVFLSCVETCRFTVHFIIFLMVCITCRFPVGNLAMLAAFFGRFRQHIHNLSVADMWWNIATFGQYAAGHVFKTTQLRLLKIVSFSNDDWLNCYGLYININNNNSMTLSINSRHIRTRYSPIIRSLGLVWCLHSD